MSSSLSLCSSSTKATKEVLLRAVVWWVNLRCYWCPIPGHEDLHYRETLRSSIKMTFIDCGISPRPAKNLSIGEIHSKPEVTRVLHQPTQDTALVLTTSSVQGLTPTMISRRPDRPLPPEDLPKGHGGGPPTEVRWGQQERPLRRTRQSNTE